MYATVDHVAVLQLAPVSHDVIVRDPVSAIEPIATMPMMRIVLDGAALRVDHDDAALGFVCAVAVAAQQVALLLVIGDRPDADHRHKRVMIPDFQALDFHFSLRYRTPMLDRSVCLAHGRR
jgi:hypothetical protein